MNFRLEDVARAAGVSRQAVYLHFGSKSGLLVALVTFVDESEGLHELAARVFEHESVVDQLDGFVDLQAEYTPRIYAIARALDQARRVDEAAAAAWNNRMEDRKTACRGIVGRLKDQGVLHPEWSVEDAVELLFVLTSIRTWEDLIVDAGWSKDRYAAALRRAARQIVLAPAQRRN